MAKLPGSTTGGALLSKKLNALLDPKNSVATDEIQALISLTVDNIVHTVSHRGIPDDDLHAAMAQIPPILDFLEKCRLTKDPSFKAFAVSKMAKLKGSLSGEKKEIGPKSVLDLSLPSAPTAENFDADINNTDLLVDEIFAKALVDHISERLAPLQIASNDDNTRLPYLYCVEFQDKLRTGIKKYIAPVMLNSRRLRTYLDSLPLAGAAYAKIREDFLLSEKENIVRHMWEDYWGGVRSTLTQNDTTDEEEDEVLAIQEKMNSGGVFSKFRKKSEKKVVNKQPEISDPSADEDIYDHWELLITPSPYRNYLLPDLGDISLIQALFQYPKDQLENNTVGVRQMLQQEGEVGGRVGSTRDHLCRLIRVLPPYCGELIAAWAYFSATDLFHLEMRRSFLASLSASEDVRRSMVPYFYAWVPKT